MDGLKVSKPALHSTLNVAVTAIVTILVLAIYSLSIRTSYDNQLFDLAQKSTSCIEQFENGQPTLTPLKNITWNSFLPNGAVKRGLVYYGTGCRLRHLISKLDQAEALTVATFGGSVTAATVGIDDKQYSYPRLFTEWLNKIFPPSKERRHTLIHAARGATRSTTFAMCMRDFVSIDTLVDLVILEFAVNDDLKTPQGIESDARMDYEVLLREALQLPGNPAVIILNHFSWIFSNNVYYKHLKKQGAEEEHTLLAKYYDIPVLSLKAAAFPLMAVGTQRLRVDQVSDGTLFKIKSYGDNWEPFFYHDALHPNRNGHEALSDLLRYAIKQAYEFSGSPACNYGVKGLPPMMIEGNTESKKCRCLLNSILFSTYTQQEANVLVQTQGFKYAPQMPERKVPVDQKWGWVATSKGSWLKATIPQCLGVKDVAHIDIAFLRSYENFGKARVMCQNGCKCEDTILDGTWGSQSTQIDVQSIEVAIDDEWEHEGESCSVYVQVENETASGGHQFTLMYIQLRKVELKEDSAVAKAGLWREWLGETV